MAAQFNAGAKKDPFMSTRQPPISKPLDSSSDCTQRDVNIPPEPVDFRFYTSKPMKIGYARVSTEDQSLDLQINNLKSAGCDKIISDHGISGSLIGRPGLDKTLRILRAGDHLVVWKLDRLGRSLIHLIKILDLLGKKGVCFRSLTECIDTSSSGGRLIFHVMAALAEFERSLISERTRAGLAAAKARGKQIGRPPSMTAAELEDAKATILSGSLSPSEVAAIYDIQYSTLMRLIRRKT